MTDYEYLEKCGWRDDSVIKEYKTKSLGKVRLHDDYDKYAVIYKPSTFKINDKVLCKTKDLSKAAGVYQQMVTQLKQLQEMLDNIEQDMNYRIVSNLRNKIGVLTKEDGWEYEPDNIGNVCSGMPSVVNDVLHAHLDGENKDGNE